MSKLNLNVGFLWKVISCLGSLEDFGLGTCGARFKIRAYFCQQRKIISASHVHAKWCSNFMQSGKRIDPCKGIFYVSRVIMFASLGHAPLGALPRPSFRDKMAAGPRWIPLFISRSKIDVRPRGNIASFLLTQVVHAVIRGREPGAKSSQKLWTE